MTDDTLLIAVDGFFHTDIVQYLHANGCPWTPKVCAVAAQYTTSETYRYAMDHGCKHAPGQCALRPWSGALICVIS